MKRRAPLGRGVLWLAVVTLVATACGNDASPPPSPTAIGARLTTTSTLEAGDPEAHPTPGSANRSGRPPAPGAAQPRTGASRPAPTVAPKPMGTADPVPGLAARQPGAFAGMLLQAQPASRLVIDILRQPGADPRAGTIDRITQVLAEASGKPVRVTDATVGITGEVHTAEEIRDAADRFGATAQGRGTAVLRVLFLSGRYVEGDSTLGITVRGDTFAVFLDQIGRAASPLAGRSLIERAVVTHELGHVLGLVDVYLNRNRDDPDHPGHSRNTGSVMFWAVESDLVTTVLGGPPPIDFDNDDRADLATIRAGAPAAR